MSLNPILCGCIIGYTLCSQFYSGNYSVVDRLWSLVPILYSWVYTLQGPIHLKQIVLSTLITLWGIRLTLNFARKGGYSGEEDYRWGHLRALITHQWLWFAFSVLFIAVYQHILLLLLTLPLYYLGLQPNAPWGLKETFCTIMFLVLLAGETWADEQQYAFQSRKYELLKKSSLQKLPMPYRLGFITTGLFRYSRHPNFFCEIGIWWTVFVFGLPDWNIWHWSGIGALLLNLLFHGSTEFTEWISAKKYPLYASYQQSTSRLFPWFPSQKDFATSGPKKVS